MKINYECMREVLIALEDMLGFDENNDYTQVHIIELCNTLTDFSLHDIGYSLVMLEEAGYIRLLDENDPIADLVCISMTFSGHQYLDTVRSSKIWDKIKEHLLDKSVEMSISSIITVGEKIINNYLSL